LNGDQEWRREAVHFGGAWKRRTSTACACTSVPADARTCQQDRSELGGWKRLLWLLLPWLLARLGKAVFLCDMAVRCFLLQEALTTIYFFFFGYRPCLLVAWKNYLCSPVTILGRLLSRLVCHCSVDGGPMGTIVDLSSKIGMECLVAARGRPQDARSVLRSPWRLVHGAVVARRPPRQGPWARSVPLKPREWASLW